MPYVLATVKQGAPQPDPRFPGQFTYPNVAHPFTYLVAGLFVQGALRGMMWFDNDTFTLEPNAARALLDFIGDMSTAWKRFEARTVQTRGFIYGASVGEVQ